MSFSGWPSEQYFFVIADCVPYVAQDTAVSATLTKALGSFVLTSKTDLKYIQIMLQKVGAHTNMEKFRLGIYSNSECDTVLCYSDYIKAKQLAEITAADWFGYITFEFNRHPLNAGLSYYVAIECEGYQNNSAGHYYGVALDWPEPVNTQAIPGRPAASMSIMGYQ